jgi:RimJ/RimL family protein N-acetyltransferase
MKLKYFLSALFRLRNLVILILSLMIAGIIKGVFPNIGFLAYLISLIAYIVSLVQTLLDTKFHEEFNHKQKIKRIQDLNYSCRRFANEARKHVSSTYNHKLRKVLQDKDDIVNSFFRGERSFLKEKLANEIIGIAGFDEIIWTNAVATTFIGIGNESFRRKGIGKEAMKLLLDFGFHELNFHRIQLIVISYNVSAIKLYEHLGFIREGVYRELVYRDGTRFDLYLYGLLKSEWVDVPK